MSLGPLSRWVQVGLGTNLLPITETSMHHRQSRPQYGIVVLYVLLSIWLSACAPVTSNPPGQAPDAANQVYRLADTYFSAFLVRVPEFATTIGRAGQRHDRLSDHTAESEGIWDKNVDEWLRTLNSIDTTSLERPASILAGALRFQLESDSAMRVCKERVRSLNQIGWQTRWPRLAQAQPVGSDSLRKQALARWGQVPRYIEVEISNLREGLATAMVAPRVVVERVRQQIRGLAETPLEESPLYSPAKRDSTPEFRRAYRTLVATQIKPALLRFAGFLDSVYLPRARAEIAISALPGGDACYRAAIFRYTTLHRTPDEIFLYGQSQVQLLSSRLQDIARQSYNTADLSEARDRLRKDPNNTVADRDSATAQIEEMMARSKTNLPRWFGILPKADITVVATPVSLERSASGGTYVAAPETGSRPAVFQLNLYQATQPGALPSLPVVAFHEAIPGHHLQSAIARERGSGTHPLLRFLGNSAFGEGWASYAEDVAGEMGLYVTPAEQFSALEFRLFGMATLVAETGIHAKGWSRPQAVDYLMTRSSRTQEQAERDVDRRIGLPGQGLSYMVGYQEFRQLRGEAERALGSKFSIRDFHDRVLEDGNLTLPQLRAKLRTWMSVSGMTAGAASK
jgi:uncharacterized protein (DUF885 family)